MGRKPEYPGKNHLTHPQAEHDLSHGERFRVKLRAYSVYSLEGIIFPTDLKEDLLNKISLLFRKVSMRLYGLADNICFSQDVDIKVALSSLQCSIIELVLVA